MTTFTRTRGEIDFNFNGTSLDIWIRINGRPRWFAVEYKELLRGIILYLTATSVDRKQYMNIILGADSDGNEEQDIEHVRVIDNYNYTSHQS